MKRLILPLFMLFLLFCCYSCKEKEPVFPVVKHLIAEKVKAENTGVARISIYKDLLIVTPMGSFTDNTIDVYSWPDIVFLYSMGTKGRGPGEVSQSATLLQSNNSDYMYVKGISSPLNIRKFAIDSTRRLLPVSDYSIGRFPSSMSKPFLINDSLYISDDFAVKIVEKYDIINQNPLGEIKYATEESESSIDMDWGIMLANGSEISYIYSFRPEIYVYDINTLKLTRKIKLKSKEIPLSPDKMNPYYIYLDAFAGEKYYYLLYMGDYLDNYHPSISQIEVYDHDWNPVIKYTFDIAPTTFVVDEDRGLILSSNYVSDDTDHFLIYDMNR